MGQTYSLGVQVIIALPEESGFKYVLLPGLDGTGNLFKSFINQFPPSADVVVISYPPDQYLSFLEVIDYVIEKIPKNVPVVLLGESYSGPVALAIAARKVINIHALILVATFARYPASLFKVISRFLPLSMLFRLPIPDFIIRRYCFGDVDDQVLYDNLRLAVKFNKPDVLAQRAHDGASIDVTAQLDEIDVPCLYLAARADRMVPKQAALRLQGQMKNLSVQVVDGPHFILQTKPRQCYELISAFIRDMGWRLP